MGKNALNAGAFARAVEWFEEAFVLAGLEANQTIHQDLVLQFLNTAIRKVRRIHCSVWHQNKYQTITNVKMMLQHDENVNELGVESVTFSRPLREKPAALQRREIVNNRSYRLGRCSVNYCIRFL